jgi:ubiquinone/menaquinone biosynthesis C-methylase UbiE
LKTPSYVFENSPPEFERLKLQSAILRPITERLLQSIEVSGGMRVLDLGSGVGDVALLAAERVGPSGAVVGIDRDPRSVAAASERARTRGFQHVNFEVGAVEEYHVREKFDVAIGRYVLVHQADPCAFIRAAARHLKPGGVVAFHEISLYQGYHCRPSVPAWEEMAKVLNAAFRHGAGSWDAAGHLVELFMNAGLPCPKLFAEVLVDGGEDSPFYVWLAETARSLLSPAIDSGEVSAQEVKIDTLADRMKAEVVRARGQLEVASQVCAWVRL